MNALKSKQIKWMQNLDLKLFINIYLYINNILFYFNKIIYYIIY